jgi:predicted RNA-binding Zn-ribbon protein involved in translation (DUF1610 family)
LFVPGPLSAIIFYMETPLASSASVTQTLNCTQCGGELHPDEGQIFLNCPYCGATVYLDTSRVVFHWYVAPTLDEQQAGAALRRWMSGSRTVKDLDKKATVSGSSFLYFPLWYFRKRTGQREEITLVPAAATSVSELSHLTLPAGDLRKYESRLDAQAEPPTVPLEAALNWSGGQKGLSLPAPAGGTVSAVDAMQSVYTQALDRAQQHAASQGVDMFAQLEEIDRESGNERTPEEEERLRAMLAARGASAAPAATAAVQEMSLVHVPLFFFKYSFGGQSYTAVVDAASGTVLANIFPAKQEIPYRLVGGVTALVYLCLATFPIIGMLTGEDGVFTGAALCIGLGGLAAPFLFAWAFWVASKV